MSQKRPGRRQARRDERVARLEALYDQVPEINCKGLCTDQCTAIGMSHLERERCSAAGVDIPPWKQKRDLGGPCPALDADGRCLVYPVRPLICRVWGACRGLPCPHGCRPVNGQLLDDTTTHKMIAESVRIGRGSEDFPSRPISDEGIEQLFADPVIAMLAGLVTRGALTVTQVAPLINERRSRL